jgi:carbonic anhydrase
MNMHRLLTIRKKEDIPEDFRETPIGDLLLYHNSNMPHKNYENAELLIGMCMDNRKQLNIPENFAFILRAGGANLRYSEFKVSYAIAVGGVECIALIGHTQCGMVNLKARKEQFVKGLCDHAGWDVQAAEEHFAQDSPMFEIGNEIDFILSETKRLSLKYPKVKVAPLLYKLEDDLLYWIDSNN